MKLIRNYLILFFCLALFSSSILPVEAYKTDRVGKSLDYPDVNIVVGDDFILEEVVYLDNGQLHRAETYYYSDNTYTITVSSKDETVVQSGETDYITISKLLIPQIVPLFNGNRDVYIGTVTYVRGLEASDSTSFALAFMGMFPSTFSFAIGLASMAISAFSGTSFYVRIQVDTYEQWSWAGGIGQPSYFLGYYWMNSNLRVYNNAQCTGQYVADYYNWTSTTPGI